MKPSVWKVCFRTKCTCFQYIDRFSRETPSSLSCLRDTPLFHFFLVASARTHIKVATSGLGAPPDVLSAGGALAFVEPAAVRADGIVRSTDVRTRGLRSRRVEGGAGERGRGGRRWH